MKNVRACHGLGMFTVLIDEGVAGGEAGLLSDTQSADDPAVGATLHDICEMREKLQFLWQKRFVKKQSAEGWGCSVS